MTRTIRIDDDVYEGLKSLADPFEDTPNIVIRKLLIKTNIIKGKDESGANVRKPRAKRGVLTQQRFKRQPIGGQRKKTGKWPSPMI